jgi:general secretion pathway protein H
VRTHPSAGPQRAFTLLELMVVLVIIGVIVSFAMFSISGRSLADTLDNEARKVHQLLQLAQEEAELQGLFVGFRPTATQWQWVGVGGDGQWQPYAESGPLRARAVTEPVRMELIIDGRPVPPAIVEVDADASLEPLGLFVASGEATPMVIDLYAEATDLAYRIEVNGLGQIERRRIERDQVGRVARR